MIYSRSRNLNRHMIAAILALMTMAVIPMLPVHAGGIIVELCTADGEVRTIAIPLEDGDGGEDGRECASPCHTVLSRKSGKQHGDQN